MTVDWKASDLAFLRKQLLRGNAVLLAGAGFSVDARNKNGNSPPLGRELARLLAKEAGFEYKDEPLQTVFHSVERRTGSGSLRERLRALYDIKEADDWYRHVASVVWHRIYTTNIDSLFQHIYQGDSEQDLRTIVCPTSPEERDPHFESLQCVHLHGHVNFPQLGFTFTLEEFAAQTATSNAWYQNLIDDFIYRPVVIVGTALEEPPFHHYLELRQQKTDQRKDVGAKSFLVSPSISAIRQQSCTARNVVPVEASGAEFFSSLFEHEDPEEHSLGETRKRVFPHLSFREDKKATDRSVNRYFDAIVPGNLPATHKSAAESFFLGAEPNWEDIEKNRDGARDVNKKLQDAVLDRHGQFHCVLLHGPAGSGKSTTLRRVAYSLAQEGSNVYYSRNEERPDFGGIIELASEAGAEAERLFVVLDNATRYLGSLSALGDELRSSSRLTLILADRANTCSSHWPSLVRFKPVEVAMPDLSSSDVEAILDRLAEFGFLGALRGKPRNEQVRSFLERANKQLLVAMREATSGQGFDVILRSEYEQLDATARLAYVICCLAVARGAPGVYRKQLLPALGKRLSSRDLLFDEGLRGVLVSANQSGSLVKPRHRLIAHWVSREIAEDEVKYEAAKAFLTQVSGSIVPNEIRRRSPAYLAYRGMINCDGLWESFSGDASIVIGLYDELLECYRDDFLFWLQYGMAHIRAGNLDTAENFLNQSLAIRPENNFQADNQIAILYLRQAAESRQPGSAVEKAGKAMDLLRAQILARGEDDTYPYGAYLTYVSRWYTQAGQLVSQKEWEDLRRVGKEAKERHPRDETIASATKEVERLYMMRAVKI